MGCIFHPRLILSLGIIFALFYHQHLILRCQAAMGHVPFGGGVGGGLRAKNNKLRPHNLIPRFKIPRGNLSFYQNPHWEILYFLKYGTFPYTADPNFNQTRFINKLHQIKRLLEKNPDGAGGFGVPLDRLGFDGGGGGGSRMGSPGQGYHKGDEGEADRYQELQPLSDEEAFFPLPETLEHFLPAGEDEVDAAEGDEEAGGKAMENFLHNSQDSGDTRGFTRISKSEQPPKAEGDEDLVEEEPVIPLLPQLINILNKEQSLRSLRSLQKQHDELSFQEHPPVETPFDGKSLILRNFILEYDPNWIRSKARAKARELHHRWEGLPRSNQRMVLINPMASRSVPDEGAGDASQGGKSLERKGNRKFQTQGW